MSESAGIADRLRRIAQQFPSQPAVLEPGRFRGPSTSYTQTTFGELDQQTDCIAAGLSQRGLQPGMKLVLFVPFSTQFISLTFALFKAGAIVVLIDPGMGRLNIVNCLKEVDPDGFVSIPKGQLARLRYRHLFPHAQLNVSTRFWMPGTVATLRQLRATRVTQRPDLSVAADDPAAIIFTSGSTGPPKGVLYEHGMFAAQVEMIQHHFGIQPGEVDLPGFPLFGLFNAAMGVTTVIPDMDPTRPADVDPIRIVTAIQHQRVTQAFGSPAFWNRIGRYCEEHGITLPTLKRALSAGGPVPIHVLERMQHVLSQPGADLYTPYGATESLPVACIGGQTVLADTAARTRQGKGTCVGKCFAGVDVRIIEITDGPLDSMEQATCLPPGEIGEIVVRSRSVTREYFNRPAATQLAKIPDGQTFWHRIGDVGYFDEAGNLWFCGRKAHIVETSEGRMFSVCCEAIYNEHPRIYRTALTGIGTRPAQMPVLVAEPEEGQFPETPADRNRLIHELLILGQAHPLTKSIETILLHRSLPVDTRHNVKINREALADWAVAQLPQSADCQAVQASRATPGR